MDHRDERLARNETLFREVNERVEEIARGSGSMFTEFTCECAAETCSEKVSLTLVEYESARGSPKTFVVRVGHVRPEIERVVGGESDRYELVEKLGEAGEVAAETDPRSR
jgi:hypothetical protein